MLIIPSGWRWCCSFRLESQRRMKSKRQRLVLRAWFYCQGSRWLYSSVSALSKGGKVNRRRYYATICVTLLLIVSSSTIRLVWCHPRFVVTSSSATMATTTANRGRDDQISCRRYCGLSLVGGWIVEERNEYFVPFDCRADAEIGKKSKLFFKLLLLLVVTKK